MPEYSSKVAYLMRRTTAAMARASSPTSLEKRKYYSSPSYFYRVLRKHDIVKWYGDEPSVSVPELRQYPPLDYRTPIFAGCMKAKEAEIKDIES